MGEKRNLFSLASFNFSACAMCTLYALTHKPYHQGDQMTNIIYLLTLDERKLVSFFLSSEKRGWWTVWIFFFISEVPRKTVTNWIRRVKLNLWFTLYVGGVTFTHWIKPSHSFDDKTIRLYGFSKSARRIVREENRKKNRKAFDTIFCHSQMLETRWSHRRCHICTHWKTFLWMKSRE